MRFTTSIFAAVAAGAAFASARNISPQCQAALAGVVVSPDFACLNPVGIAGIAATPLDKSIIPSVDTWLKGLCALAACTNTNIANIATAIAKGCPAEVADVNITLADIQRVYPPARKVACLVDTRDSTLCVTQTLNNIEADTGTLSPSNIPTIVSDLTSGANTLPNTVICTDCIKNAVIIFEKELPGLFKAPKINPKLAAKCGASFVDGIPPPTITESAK